MSFVRPAEDVPAAYPHMPTPERVMAVQHEYSVPGAYLRPIASPPPGWSAQDLTVRAALGEPPVNDEVAFSAYAARSAAMLLGMPTYPSGVLGAVLWAFATSCERYAARVAADARDVPRTPPMRALSAADSDRLEEDAEWREYEGQLRLGRIEALRDAGSHTAADCFEELAAAGLDY